MSNQVIDLGAGHTLRFFSWAPDRALNTQYDDVPDVERYGAIISHHRSDGSGECESGIVFDGDVQRLHNLNRPGWTVESWEPLTLSPSLLCNICGDHGFIRNGCWEPC